MFHFLNLTEGEADLTCGGSTVWGLGNGRPGANEEARETHKPPCPMLHAAGAARGVQGGPHLLVQRGQQCLVGAPHDG